MRLAPQLGQNPRRSPKAPTVGAAERDQVFMMTFSALHPQDKSAGLPICTTEGRPKGAAQGCTA